MLVYVDTNIVLDAVLDRESIAGRDLGTPAMSLFSRAAMCQFDIVVSEWMLQELYRQIEPEPAKALFTTLGENDKIVRQEWNDDDLSAAKAVASHWEDALHGILAKKAEADCIVTRNVDDFQLFSGLDVKLPEHV